MSSGDAFRWTILALLLASASCRSPRTLDSDYERIRSEIELLLSVAIPDLVPEARDREQLMGELVEFYRVRDHFPAWHNATELSDAGRAALQTLRRADEHGLRVDDYLHDILAGDDLVDARPKEKPDAAAHLEVALSLATMRYIKDIHQGRLSPVQVGFALAVSHHHPNLSEELIEVASSHRVSEKLEAFAPPYSDYHRLKVALAKYRELEENDRWQPLPDERTVHPGQAYEQVGRLRGRLRGTGDLPESAESVGPLYDAFLVAAVIRFQGRHGLNSDGVIGRQTFVALNTPWSERVLQIIASMERWRWVSGHFDGKAILVNIPEFKLRGIEADGSKRRESFESRVIVGQHYHDLRTPIFAGKLSYIDFWPYWSVPVSIVRNEIAEHLDEPGYLRRHGYEIVRDTSFEAEALPTTPSNVAKVRDGTLQLRQRPGPGNALGLVKFVFPNRYSVFLHSTPEPRLFQREERAFSHGCVRIADATGLAEWILDGQPGWDRERIAAVVADGPTTRVLVERDVPVHILYLTAYVEDVSDAVHFGRDIYELDTELLKALAG